MAADDPAYRRRIGDLHRALGLPADYAERRGLTLQPEAGADVLVEIATRDDGAAVRLIAPAATAWGRLQAAARTAGVELFAVSGFRSVDRQAEIIRRHLAAGRSREDLLSQVAAPGYSEHHTGCALDLGTPGCGDLTVRFERTAAFAWLATQAGTYSYHLSYPRNNLHGIGFEPWHWCWRNSP